MVLLEWLSKYESYDVYDLPATTPNTDTMLNGVGIVQSTFGTPSAAISSALCVELGGASLRRNITASYATACFRQCLMGSFTTVSSFYNRITAQYTRLGVSKWRLRMYSSSVVACEVTGLKHHLKRIRHEEKKSEEGVTRRRFRSWALGGRSRRMAEAWGKTRVVLAIIQLPTCTLAWLSELRRGSDTLLK